MDNGLDDLNGLLCVSGSNNSVVGNHFSQVIDGGHPPRGCHACHHPAEGGVGNFVSNNHVVAMDVHSTSSDSCFAAQVDALVTIEASDGLAVTAVMVDSESARNTILDSGSDAQVIADRAANASQLAAPRGVPRPRHQIPGDIKAGNAQGPAGGGKVYQRIEHGGRRLLGPGTVSVGLEADRVDTGIGPPGRQAAARSGQPGRRWPH